MNNPIFSPAPETASSFDPLILRATPPAFAVKSLVAATAVALLILPAARGAYAQAIGDIDVRSRLGERFFASVPVQSDKALDPNCIRVGPNRSAPEGADALSGARVRINPTGAVESVIIETAGVVDSPVVGVRLEVGCTNPVVRDFVILGEGVPLPVASVEPVKTVPVAPRVAPRRAPARPPATTARATPPGPTAAVPAPAPRVTAPAPKLELQASGSELIPKAPVVSSHSGAPAAAATAAPAPARSTAQAEPEGQTRVAELRARSDDHAASLLALEDRLSVLQKHAELLKAQLQQVLATPASGAPVDGANSAQSAPPAVAAAGSAASAASAPATMSASAATAPRSMSNVLMDWRVLGGGLGGILLAALAYKLGRRRPLARPAAAPSVAAQPRASTRQPAAPRGTQDFSAATMIPEAERTAEWVRTAQFLNADETMQWSKPPTTSNLPVPEPAADASRPVNPGVGITRDFHITQQFQPSTERTVAISSPDEIVQQARTHYMDDGDTFRAIDLLEMAVSVRTDSTRPWQALFAIYRRENMAERFQRLALAYRQAFGEDSNWPAIRGLGYGLDANNPLYAAAANDAPAADDLLERWLGVPLDFTAHLLASEMHDKLMETSPGRGGKRKRASGE